MAESGPTVNRRGGAGAGGRVPVAAVLFDLDGTLVDSAPDLGTAVNRVLAELGRRPVTESQVRDWIGNGAARLVKRALTGLSDGEPEAALFDDAYRRFCVHYGNHLCVDSRIYPGVRTLLQTLAAGDCPMGCVTNKPAGFTEPLLHRLGLSGYFAAVVSGDTLAEKKPDPAPLLHAGAMLGIEGSVCLVVGDSASDLEAARAAAMPAVAVSYGYHRGVDLRRYGPLAVVDRIDEITALVTIRPRPGRAAGRTRR